jgi:LacI family transcriptional regulator
MLPPVAVTLLDIAKDLKVSVVTVSKALRNQGKISAATRKRVLERAKELNYQTNWVARSLVTRRTYTIGLLLPDFTHPFFSEIAKAVAETIRPLGYHLIVTYFEEDAALERSEAESLVARQVDGLIVASAQPADCLDMFEDIRKRKVPYVLIDRPMKGARASFVGVDNQAIGRLATEHLIAQGCRHIAHLRGPELGIAADRLAGYCQALLMHDLTMPPEYVVEALYGDQSGYKAMLKLLRVRPRPDGVFCYNDPVAIGAMTAILEQGLEIPKDVAVVGAGNVHYSDLLSVPLSTVDQSTRQIGTRAAELLLEQIGAKRPIRPRKILIEPQLIARQSTRRDLKTDDFRTDGDGNHLNLRAPISASRLD